MLERNLIEEEYHFLRPDIYLNTASEGIPPLRTQRAIEQFPTDCFRRAGRKSAKPEEKHAAELKERFSTLIHAEGPQQIGIVKNTTEGMSLFANGYPFAEDDNIVIAQIEHPSCLFPWVNLSEKTGISLRVIPKSEQELTPEVVMAKTDCHTRVVVLSAVQYSNGYFADLKAIGAACKKRGILLVVDGIQAMGRLKIDVQECNIDYLATGGHKGLLGISGVALVYCSPNLVSLIRPPYAGMQSTTMRGHTTVLDDFSHIHWLNTAERFEAGVANYLGICALTESLGFLLQLGIESIQAHILQLERQVRSRLSHYQPYLNTFSEEGRYSGIICIQLPDIPENIVGKILAKHSVMATSRNGYVRFCIGLYNTPEDMDALVACIDEILRTAERR